MDAAQDAAYAGQIPDVYDELLVPLIFETYAADLAGRLGDLSSGAVLEVAAGTGVVTRALAEALPSAVAITATDLNSDMLDRAQRVGTSRPIEWQQADATSLPFDDKSFDVGVCQFGVMFFPDRGVAFAELRRVLRPGGRLLFNTWDRLDRNPFPATVDAAVTAMFPDQPPLFLGRTPYAYHDTDAIKADLSAGGFDDVSIDRLVVESRAPTAEAVAVGFIRGTPLSDEVERIGPGRVGEAIEKATAAVADRFGSEHPVAEISALVVTATR
jgi:SAM-dependent methyltransferase